LVESTAVGARHATRSAISGSSWRQRTPGDPPGNAISHSGTRSSRRAQGNRTAATAGALPADGNLASNLRRGESGSRHKIMARPEWQLSGKTCRHNAKHAVPDRVHRQDRLDKNLQGDCRRDLCASRPHFPTQLHRVREPLCTDPTPVARTRGPVSEICEGRMGAYSVLATSW
jgi:hypothetical protein